MSRFINKIFILIFFCSFFLSRPVFAQESEALKLSITPPIFKVNMNPGETWSSIVKLVNNNTYPVTIYAEVLDFKSGATGGVEFIRDRAGEKENNSLSGWVEINREPVVIAPGQSAELPFFIKLPAAADPGGHYAAILAGSKPPAEKQAGSAIKISSMLASLLLVRVSGQIVEQGEIREFSVDKNLNGDLSAKLKVGFMNTGNTHLQPQGEIKITNIWGETRATIPINQKSNFGNVLPESEKRWEFDWKGESSILDAGRLRADLVVGFGEEATQTDSRTIYFWSFALKPTATALGIIIFILLLIILLIRRYINKSLRQVRAQAELLSQKEKMPAGAAGLINLRGGYEPDKKEPAQEQLSWSMFKRITVFLIIIILAAMFALGFYYFGGFRQSGMPPAIEQSKVKTAGEETGQENAEAVSTESTAATTTAPEPVSAAATSSAPATSSPSAEPGAATTTAEQEIVKASIKNGGGVPGAAARAAALIKPAGIEIVSLGNADNFDYQTTEIRFRAGDKTAAEAANRLLGGTARLIEDETITDDLAVILGKDFK